MTNGKIRTMPTTMITGLWDPGSESKVPERVKVRMSDGSSAVYQLSVEQPHPQCLKAVDLIRIMTGNTYGGNKNGR